MSAYIIIRKAAPHPLDGVWNFVREQLEASEAALAALPDDCSDEQVDAIADQRSRDIGAIMALPARNLDDMMFKLDTAHGGHNDIRTDCSLNAIIDEALDLITDSMAPAAARFDWTEALQAWTQANAAATLGERGPQADVLVEAESAAQDKLHATAVPDHAALLTKIDVARNRWDGFEWPDEVWDSVRADIARLGGLAVSA